jgi:hypothetical protein
MVRAGLEWSGDLRDKGLDLVYLLVLDHLSHHIHSFHPTIPRYRNDTNPRLIPDGAITAAHFIKTPYYVQIHGFWDGTSMNIVRLSPIIMNIY